MAPFVVRRSERIDYRVPVTLFATRANVAPVIARSMDVSEGGMRVFAPIPVPVGATVRCELTLDGRTATLEGKVAWLEDPAPEVAAELEDAADIGLGMGMGIRFETLSHEDSGVLRHLVARATEGYMPAELELPGVRTRVAARAVPTSSGARISASLPWLRRGASVGVRFVGAPDDVHGHITDAVLRELPNGGRRLQIEVEADAPARERRDTRYGDALDFERARKLDFERARAREPNQIEAQTARDGGAADDSRDPHAPSSFEPPPAPSRTWLALACGLLIGSAATLGATSLAGTGTWPIWARNEGRPSTPSQAIEATPLAAPKKRSVASHNSATPAPPATPSALLAAAPESLSTALPGTSGASTPTVTAAPTAASAAAPIEEHAAADPNAQPLDDAPALVQPMIEVDGATSIVRVPFRGTLTGMVARVWAEPYALAIDLPDGKSSLVPGRYALHDNTATSLRLQERSNLSLLRIGLGQPIATHSVSISGEVLEVRITPRAMPHAIIDSPAQ